MDTQVARARISGIVTSYMFAQALYSVAALEVADKLAGGPLTAEELAQRTGSSASHLERVMLALSSIGVFTRTPSGFALNFVSEFLRKDHAETVWPMAMFHGDEMYRAFGRLLDNVRTGTPAWQVAMRKPVWQYLEEHPERGALFDKVMRLNHLDDVAEMVAACDFPPDAIVADVGGGDGSMLAEVLRQNPSVQGILFDMPQVIERTRSSVEWQALGDRCRFESGSFFEDMPRGASVYLLRHVLHDWEDEECRRILRRCHGVMDGNARLVIIEALMSGNRSRSHADWSDMSMMAIGGRERSLEAFRALLEQSGFRLIDSSPPGVRVSFIEARIS